MYEFFRIFGIAGCGILSFSSQTLERFYYARKSHRNSGLGTAYIMSEGHSVRL